jgi:hypothetical protein
MKALKPQMRAFNAYKAKVDALNEALIRKIEALPDNPEINRIDANCFTISSKALGTQNWTPDYHDFPKQYKFIRAIIENYDINQVEQIFKEILLKGSIRLNRSDLIITDGSHISGKDTYYFHPEVLKMLKETLM